MARAEFVEFEARVIELPQWVTWLVLVAGVAAILLLLIAIWRRSRR